MELITESGMKAERLVKTLQGEADELVRIVVSSIRTARRTIRNPQSKIQNPR
jgi:hypothetical protein